MVGEAYRSHGGAVYSVARGLSSPLLAREITGDVFIRFQRVHGCFDPAESSLRAFLLKMTHDAVRRRTPSRDPGGAPDRVSAGEQEPRRSDDSVPPRERLLDGLSADGRRALVTIVYGGCTFREASTILGQDKETFRRTIGDALRSLGRTRTRAAAVPVEEVDGELPTAEGLPEALERGRPSPRSKA